MPLIATFRKRLLPYCALRESREQVKSAEQLTTAKREKRGEIVAKLARSGWEIAPSRWPTFISCCATLTLLQVRCASVVKESLSRAGGIGAPRTHLLFGRNRHISFSGKKNLYYCLSFRCAGFAENNLWGSSDLLWSLSICIVSLISSLLSLLPLICKVLLRCVISFFRLIYINIKRQFQQLFDSLHWKGNKIKNM